MFVCLYISFCLAFSCAIDRPRSIPHTFNGHHRSSANGAFAFRPSSELEKRSRLQQAIEAYDIGFGLKSKRLLRHPKAWAIMLPFGNCKIFANTHLYKCTYLHTYMTYAINSFWNFPVQCTSWRHTYISMYACM